MRRSFGGNHGRGSGGGGGSGNMLRTLARTVSRASSTSIQEPFSSSSNNSLNKTIKTPTSPAVAKSRNNNCLSLSSPPASAANSPFVTSPTGHHSRTWARSRSFNSLCDHDFVDWVCVDDHGSDYNNYYFDDDTSFVLGPAPSQHEAQSAVTALQHVIETTSFSQLVRDKYGTSTNSDILSRAASPTGFSQRTASSISESEWSEPSLQLCGPTALQSYGSGSVYDAFHLLQNDPCIQRMVISLSSDPAVWNAVLNNEVVLELKQTISPDNDGITSVKDNSDDSEAAASILKWLFDNTKAKVVEIIEMINRLVNDLFPPFEGDDRKSSTTSTDAFEEKLRYSLMLTVVVLLIVAVARAKRA